MIKIEFTSKDIDNLHYERFNYPSPRVQLKMEVLYLKSQNLPHSMITSLCKISSVTLVEYLRQYDQGGIERLKLNLHKGKNNDLQPHQESLKEIFIRNPPRSTKEAAQIIKEHTGIERKLTQVREFLTRMGLQYRKVATIPGKVVVNGLAEKQDQFKEEELTPKITEARSGKRELFFWMPRTSFTEPS
jgi:transposase